MFLRRGSLLWCIGLFQQIRAVDWIPHMDLDPPVIHYFRVLLFPWELAFFNLLSFSYFNKSSDRTIYLGTKYDTSINFYLLEQIFLRSWCYCSASFPAKAFSLVIPFYLTSLVTYNQLYGFYHYHSDTDSRPTCNLLVLDLDSNSICTKQMTRRLYKNHKYFYDCLVISFFFNVIYVAFTQFIAEWW